MSGFPAVRLELAYHEDGSTRARTVQLLAAGGAVQSSSAYAFGVDGYGRLLDVQLNGAALVTATYDGNGLLSGGRFANGDRLTFTRDDTTRRLTGSSQATASYTASTLQRLNARALMESERIAVGATTLARTFGSSSQRFLASASDARHAYAYTFDGPGLPRSVTADGVTRTIVESAGTLTAGRVTYGFDALHRTVSRTDAAAPAQQLTLTYGPDGQVATATKGAETFRFLYDENGQRLVKLAGTAPKAAYLEEGYLDASGLTERFELGGRTVGVIKNGAFTTIATDLRGSVLAEPTGVLRVASPFGQRDVHPATAAAIDYVEKGWDADLGLVRMGVRDYDPELDRFTTADPLFLEKPEQCVKSPVECNLYAYARGAPTLFVDPTGHYSAMPSIWGPEGGPLQWGAEWLAAKMAAVSLDESMPIEVRASAAVVGTVASLFDAETTEKTGAVMGLAGSIKMVGGRFLSLEPALVGESRLVGANRAIIDPRKLTDYVLNPSHPVGGNKAVVFERLGFTRSNAEVLMSQIRSGVMDNSPIAGKADQFGSRFTVDIPVVGPNACGTVRTGWIYKPGSATPSLTTLFVK